MTTTDHPTPAHLRRTARIDSDAPAVQAFAAEHAIGTTDRERAVALYLAVRDGFRYDPYRIDLSPQGMTASTVLANGYGWCVPKAALLTAVCRAAGIPARMGFADVRNHPRTCLRLCRGRAAVLAGWDARRGAPWIARLSTSAATPQTARQARCPKGWSEIGRLDASNACMGMSPCGASEASTHPDCAPTRPLQSRKQVLTTERMRETMKTDLFIWHGYTDIWLEGQWRKATPAFNIELCDRFGLLPLTFDGENDSIYHPFDKTGQRHMEYVRQRGAFDDLPLAQIVADFQAVYGGWLSGGGTTSALHGASFDSDVAREVAQ